MIEEEHILKKILLFCDPGIDDAVAIMYAHFHPEIEIVGIVASYGNTTRDNAVRNTVYLLMHLGIDDVPVFSGAETPFRGEEPKVHEEIHGEYGLGTINVSKHINLEPFENFFDVIDLIKTNINDLTIVTTGRLTSIASLCIFYPNLMKEMKEIIVMGGAFFAPGNITPIAEANFHGDAVAANAIIQSRANITLIPLNVTNSVFISPQIVNLISEATGDEIFKAIIDFYYKYYTEAVGEDLPGSPLHDVVAISSIVNPDLFMFRNYRVYVEHNQVLTIGATFPDIRPLANLPAAPKHKVAVGVNSQQFVNDFIYTFTGDERIVRQAKPN